MDFRQILSIINQVAKERNIAPEKVIMALEDSIATAYRKEYGERGEIVKAKIDMETGEAHFWQEKEVVDESTVRIVEETEEDEGKEQKGKEAEQIEEEEDDEDKLPRYNSERHIFLDEAKKIKKDAILGDILEFPLESKIDFGRIAAQSAKQVVLQKFREAEKETIFGEFRSREGSIVTGTISRVERGIITVDLGKINGVVFPAETVQGEQYPINDKMKFYILAVQEDRRGIPQIVLSRSHPRFVVKLFEAEVPEIVDGTVEIKAIVREAGSRSKMAVYSSSPSIDPVGSCVGQKGIRVLSVTSELGNEKVDIIPWSEELEEFIAASLAPASVKSVEIYDDNYAKVIVPDDQLSLAIGKGGQNVRLAAKLTNWKIDVRSESAAYEEKDKEAEEETKPLTEEDYVSDEEQVQ